MTIAPRTFERVQVLRFVAAAAVVLAHAEWIVGARAAALRGVEAEPGLFHWMTWGVDLFFVISGFIIRYTIAAREGSSSEDASERDGGRRAWPFLRRRFERIVPLYWLCLLGTFAIMISTGAGAGGRSPGELADGLARSLGFVAWSGGTGVPILSVGWTLEYEMLFYGLAALCLAVTRRPALLLLATLALLVAAGRVIGFTKGDALMIFLANPMLIEFMFGILIANLLVGDRPALSAILVAVAMAFVPLSGMGERVWIAGLASLALVGGAVWLDVRRPLAAWLRPLVALGDASYAIYLTHLAAVGVLAAVLGRIVPDLPVVAGAPVVAAAAVLGGYLTYRLIERPLLRWVRGKYDVPPPAERTAAAQDFFPAD